MGSSWPRCSVPSPSLAKTGTTRSFPPSSRSSLESSRYHGCQRRPPGYLGRKRGVSVCRAAVPPVGRGVPAASTQRAQRLCVRHAPLTAAENVYGVVATGVRPRLRLVPAWQLRWWAYSSPWSRSRSSCCISSIETSWSTRASSSSDLNGARSHSNHRSPRPPGPPAERRCTASVRSTCSPQRERTRPYRLGRRCVDLGQKLWRCGFARESANIMRLHE